MFTQHRLGNKKIFEKNHEKILNALNKAGMKGLSVEEIRGKTAIFSRRVLYSHLKIAYIKGQIKKENHRWYWISHWENSTAIKKSLELIASLLERVPDAENVKEGIFSENIFVITPYKRPNGKNTFFCLHYPLEEFEKFPQL